MLPLAKATARQPRKWTFAEDQRLREEVEAQKNHGEVKDWCRIATKLPGRTNKDCRKRWTNSVAGGLRKGQWAKSEDVQLSKGVEQYGQRWTLVAEIVGSRSADQCAKRWQQSLDPDLDRSEWRDSEDKMLIEAVHQLGRHWKDIQRHHFPGRSKNCIKNRYTVLLRRYQNQGIALPEGAATSTPEPNTPGRHSSCSATEEDYPGVYGNFLGNHTHVSTPETRNSWSIEQESTYSWSSSDSFSIPATLASSPSQFSSYPHEIVASAPSTTQWNWPAPAVQSTVAMPINTTPSYSQTHSLPDPSYPPRYNSTMQQGAFGVAGHSHSHLHSPSMHVGAPTSSPRTLDPTTHYDAHAMSPYSTYGLPQVHESHYRY